MFTGFKWWFHPKTSTRVQNGYSPIFLQFARRNQLLPSEMKVIRKEFPRVRETKKSGSKYYEVDWFLDVFSGLTFRIGCLWRTVAGRINASSSPWPYIGISSFRRLRSRAVRRLRASYRGQLGWLLSFCKSFLPSFFHTRSPCRCPQTGRCRDRPFPTSPVAKTDRWQCPHRAMTRSAIIPVARPRASPIRCLHRRTRRVTSYPRSSNVPCPPARTGSRNTSPPTSNSLSSPSSPSSCVPVRASSGHPLHGVRES